MAKILKFPAKVPSKFGFKRVRKRKKIDLEDLGQFNLFAAPGGKVVPLPTSFSPFEEALTLDEDGNPRARDLYRKAISDGDCTADAYCNLGVLESQSGRAVKAIECFTSSLKHDSRHVESHFNLANLYFEAGDLRLARLHYEISAEIEPGSANIYFNLGLVHAMNEDYGPAVDALSRYQDLAPDEEGKKADELLTSLRRSLAAKRRREKKEGGVEREDSPGPESRTLRMDRVIESSREVLGGTPVFKGTRVPVKTLIDYLESGDSLEGFLNDFPNVTREQSLEVLELAQDSLKLKIED